MVYSFHTSLLESREQSIDLFLTHIFCIHSMIPTPTIFFCSFDHLSLMKRIAKFFMTRVPVQERLPRIILLPVPSPGFQKYAFPSYLLCPKEREEEEVMIPKVFNQHGIIEKKTLFKYSINQKVIDAGSFSQFLNFEETALLFFLFEHF